MNKIATSTSECGFLPFNYFIREFPRGRTEYRYILKTSELKILRDFFLKTSQAAFEVHERFNPAYMLDSSMWFDA